MSYASVVANNLPPPSAQPHPDTALLNTQPVEAQLPSVETIAPAEHPRSAYTEASDELETPNEHNEEETDRGADGPEERKSCRYCPKDTLKKAGEGGLQLLEKTKEYLLRPGLAGGLIGVVNVGFLGSVGYSLYAVPGHRNSPRFLSTVALTTLAVFGAEAVVADGYRKTEAGRREEARAKEEGAALYRHAKTVVLRPGVLCGAVGALNLGILGGLGYWSWVNWDKPWKCDRREIGALSVGLLALFAGEEYLDQHRKKRLPEHK